MLGHNAKQNLHEIAGLWPQFVAVALQVISLKNFHEIAGNALPEDASTSHTWVLGSPRLGIAQSQHGFGNFEQ